jgi:homoserine O-succinyltransferase/O-acetyltransferase
MPVRIPSSLPARRILEQENIFVMGTERAQSQDIRPLQIAVLNLMPDKIQTETQLLRLLGNVPLQVDVTLLHMNSHDSKNTPAEHLLAHYQTFEQVQRRKFDGLVVTGAPVEHLPYEEVDYWDELVEILDWSENHVFSTFYICWAAQAALYRKYGIPKYALAQKVFGVFPHRALASQEKLLRGFDDVFYAPHSRHTELKQADLDRIDDLIVLAKSEEAGLYLVISQDGRQVYVTGHSEYDPGTLRQEYERDLAKGLPIAPPRNYFPQDDPSQGPLVRWRGHAHLLFSNWLNYAVYQATPYDLDQIPKGGTFSAFD